MKKLLATLVALLVTGSVVFAQTAAAAPAPAPALALTGTLEGGLLYTFGEMQDPGLLKSYSKDLGVPGVGFRLNGAYTNGNAGLNFRLQSSGSTLLIPTLTIGYGWMKFVEGTVLAKVGLIDDGAWATKAVIGSDYADGGGLQFQYTGVPNLNAGFGVYTPDATGVLGYEIAKARYVAGFSYVVPSLLGVQANVEMLDKLNRALVGANVLAIKDLTLAVDAGFTGLGTYDVSGLATVTQKVQYAMLPLTACLNLSEYVPGKSGLDIGFKAEAWVTYVSGKFTPKFLGYYMMNGAPGTTNKDSSQIVVHPSVTYAFSAKAKIVGGFTYTINKGLSYGDKAKQELYSTFSFSY